MKLLITGAAGQLGKDLVLSAQKSGHQVIATIHGDLDITDKSQVDRVVGEAKADAIIHAAAWFKWVALTRRSGFN